MTIDAKALFGTIRAIAGRDLTQADVDAVNAVLGQATAPVGRKISPGGLALIKVSEGLVLKAYQDAVGVWTIGYGSTGPHVSPGKVITEAAAEQLLLDDLVRFEKAVNSLCPVTTQGQYDALVSFAFNLGENALKESTLRRLHNEGNYEAASQQFARWNKAGGRELPGLTKRRATEAKIYRSAA